MSKPTTIKPEQIVTTVRERYGDIAANATSCCGSTPCGSSSPETSTHLGYAKADLDLLPEGADLGLGCGAPLNHLELKPGETVVDLGSGAGIDALIAANRVGPTGLVIGVDMTPEMLERARDNAEKAGVGSFVDFREGRLEDLPVDDDMVDALTSNCVFNLVPDKPAVLREVARVLRPGGRLVVSDIMLDGELPEVVANNLMSWVGCVAGAMQRETYLQQVRDAGLEEVTVLRDIAYLDSVGDRLPPDLQALADESGVDLESIRPIVRSVTYRAVKR
jgi:arsenite methyltransferase